MEKNENKIVDVIATSDMHSHFLMVIMAQTFIGLVLMLMKLEKIMKMSYY